MRTPRMKRIPCPLEKTGTQALFSKRE